MLRSLRSVRCSVCACGERKRPRTTPTVSPPTRDARPTGTRVFSIRGDMVILNSCNRANLTTPPLRTPIRRAENAQDERLGPPWSHALTRKRFHFFQAARTNPGRSSSHPYRRVTTVPLAHTAPGAAPHTQLASPGPEGPVPSRVGPPRTPRGGPEAGSARRGHAWCPRAVQKTPFCVVAAARRLWGEPRGRRGDDPAQARPMGRAGNVRERAGGAEAARSGVGIATGVARVKRHARAHDLNVWTICGGALCVDIWQGVSRAR